MLTCAGSQIAAIHVKPRFLPGSLFTGESLSLKMAREGWATVYTQGGAEYGDYTLQDYLDVEKEAQ